MTTNSLKKLTSPFESASKPIINEAIDNSHRTIGTTLSHEVAKKYGNEGLSPDTITLNLEGSGGQSFAAFLSRGITINLKGDDNDYFCNGLSGGKVIISPPDKSTFNAEENIIIGNVALYGATGGSVFIRGIAGERFAVRNSGANAVVEGVGDHGCEYMTRGKVVVLGATGRNFAAGMSGGEAFVLDEHGTFKEKCNLGLIDLEDLENSADVKAVKLLIEQHLEYTGSNKAKAVLKNWPKYKEQFVKVMPRDYKRVLEEAKKDKQMGVATTNG